MEEDNILSGASITIDGEVIPVAELDFDWNNNPLINDDIEDNIPDCIRDAGEITFTFKMSRKSRKKLKTFLNSLIYKPSRLRSAIGLKRRNVR